jgi:HD-GYP domain-containing protein (c-di-GMP phosphodiesterase class II)
MKKTAAALFLMVTATMCFAQTLQDSIAQAKTAYVQGRYQQAVTMLDMAASTYATDFANKTLLADAYNEIGEREYARKNLLNAYECYRKAVKIYPTHKAASSNFWAIKQKYDVAALKNEGGGATAVASSDGTNSTGSSDPLTTTRTDGAGYTAAQLDELKRYQAELARQTELIKQLQTSYSSTRSQNSGVDPQTAAFNRQILDNLTKLYQNAISRKDTQDLEIISAQMRDYRKMFENQQSSQSTLIWVVLAALGGIILLILALLLVFYLAVRRRRKQQFSYATDYGIGLRGSEKLALEEQSPLLLTQEAQPPEGVPGAAPDRDQNQDIYRDVIRAERLKEMANEKKYGSLKWETLRNYIGELEKELRSEILYVVENKVNSGDDEDYASLLPVLFPFFTDSDEYLRDKAHRLLEQAIVKTTAPSSDYPQLDYDESGGKKSRDPLSVSALLKHVDKLKDIKPDRREHSINVAKYVRGMGMVLKLPKETQDLLYKTALVHDIGYALLDKDKLDELAEKKDMTDKEAEFVRTHPEKGIAYFKGVDIPEEMRQGILYHHERNDGSGYPKGLTRDKIPTFPKIIGIADMFDALTTNRVFREKMTFESAVVILKDLGREKIEAEYMQALIEYLKTTGKLKR